MFIALAFAIVVAVAASLERPIEPAAAKPVVKSATEPLVRSDPGVDPWVEKDIPPPRPEVTPRPPSPSKPDSRPGAKPDPKYRSDESGSGESRYGDAPEEQTLPLEE